MEGRDQASMKREEGKGECERSFSVFERGREDKRKFPSWDRTRARATPCVLSGSLVVSVGPSVHPEEQHHRGPGEVPTWCLPCLVFGLSACHLAVLSNMVWGSVLPRPRSLLVQTNFCPSLGLAQYHPSAGAAFPTLLAPRLSLSLHSVASFHSSSPHSQFESSLFMADFLPQLIEFATQLDLQRLIVFQTVRVFSFTHHLASRHRKLTSFWGQQPDFESLWWYPYRTLLQHPLVVLWPLCVPTPRLI